jgi:peroxiredoxin
MLETIILAFAVSFGSGQRLHYHLDHEQHRLRPDAVQITAMHRTIAVAQSPFANQCRAKSNPGTESHASPRVMHVTRARVGSPRVQGFNIVPIDDKELAGAIDLEGLIRSAGTAAGRQAPSFSLPTLDGTEVSLEAMHGKIVLLNFWASWCGPCRTEMPSLEQLYRDFSAHPDFALLTVSTEGSTLSVGNFMTKNGYDFPVLLDADNAVSRAFGVSALPSTFVIDREGRIVWNNSGALDWSDSRLRDALKKLLEKKPRRSIGTIEARLSGIHG